MHDIYIEKVHYDFVQLENNIDGIKLLTGNYKDVLFHYHKVKVTDLGGYGKMDFGYTIVEPGIWNIDVLNQDKDFHKVMGDILTILLLKRIENDENRDDNSEEPTFQ